MARAALFFYALKRPWAGLIGGGAAGQGFSWRGRERLKLGGFRTL